MKARVFTALCIIACLCILNACSTGQQEGARTDWKEPVINADRLVERQGIHFPVNSQTPFTGTVTNNFLFSDMIAARFAMKDGLNHGPFETYHDYDVLAHRGTYRKGKLEGLRQEFYENGQLKRAVNYENDLREGPFEYYYENGQLRLKGSNVNDLREGPYEWFNKNGSIKEKGTMVADKKHGTIYKYDARGVDQVYTCRNDDCRPGNVYTE